MRSSAAVAARPPCENRAVTDSAPTFGSVAGAVTSQLSAADVPAVIRATEAGVECALAVQPAGSFSAAVTWRAAGLPAGRRPSRWR